jgi:hypothetical protein
VAGAGLNVGGNSPADSWPTPERHGNVIDEPDERRGSPRLTRSCTRVAARHPVSGRDRIVGAMTVSGSHDALPSNRGRGATMGPPACSDQSPPVAFRRRCLIVLQGLSSNWDDWRGQKVFLIRKRSQVRVLDRPLGGLHVWPRFMFTFGADGTDVGVRADGVVAVGGCGAGCGGRWRLGWRGCDRRLVGGWRRLVVGWGAAVF